MLASAVAVRADEGDDAPPTSDSLRAWIVELDAPEFATRDRATRALLRAGFAAVAPLERAAPALSREAVGRAADVLRELALADDDVLAEHAHAALLRLGENPDSPRARRAFGEVLAGLAEIRANRAVAALRKAGAKIEFRSQITGVWETGMMTVEIGSDWQGAAADFRALRWLRDVERVVLKHPSVDDEALARLGGNAATTSLEIHSPAITPGGLKTLEALPNLRQLALVGENFTDAALAQTRSLKNLRSLEIKRARVTDVGLRALDDLPNLQSLGVLYTPVSDASLPRIEELANLGHVKLFGTKVTPEGAQALAQKLPNARVDYRRGGFLGVGCANVEAGCVVMTVHPGSAADKAQLKAGDIITRFAGADIDSFEALTARISNVAAAEAVKLEVLRDGEPREVSLVLGEW